MQMPVRCFTCGNLIGKHADEYKKRVAKGEKAEKVLDDLGVTRYCCRRMFLTSLDLMDEVKHYKKY